MATAFLHSSVGKDSRKVTSDSPVLGPKSGPPPPPPGVNSKKTQPPPPPEQQEPAGQRGRSGSLDSPLLSRKSAAAPPVPKGNRKVQPDLVKELSLKLQKGNVGTVGTEETDSVEAPLTDDLEFQGDRSDLTGMKIQGHHHGNRISASVSVDGLSDRALRTKKRRCPYCQDGGVFMVEWVGGAVRVEWVGGVVRVEWVGGAVRLEWVGERLGWSG